VLVPLLFIVITYFIIIASGMESRCFGERLVQQVAKTHFRKTVLGWRNVYTYILCDIMLQSDEVTKSAVYISDGETTSTEYLIFVSLPSEYGRRVYVFCIVIIDLNRASGNASARKSIGAPTSIGRFATDKLRIYFYLLLLLRFHFSTNNKSMGVYHFAWSPLIQMNIFMHIDCTKILHSFFFSF